MSVFSALTPDQQSQILAFMPIFRANMGLVARAMTGMAQMDGIYQGNVLSLITELDAGTAIPDSTGLAGAVTLVREEVLGMMAAVEACLAAYNTPVNRVEWARAAGFANTIG